MELRLNLMTFLVVFSLTTIALHAWSVRRRFFGRAKKPSTSVGASPDGTMTLSPLTGAITVSSSSITVGREGPDWNEPLFSTVPRIPLLPIPSTSAVATPGISGTVGLNFCEDMR